ncbi:tetratricopeptide repeat protein [uncultured Algoriphagus sp.]|jgi:signal transduction histidine kinase/Flp pilus assembly protein TadD|uniref:tetratricopeptide repeat-containing sensor histidine kinase n=1 Tax=uncultured Algoriphagus sp. TaxID=417365 RepID=UPI00106589C2|nr:tetratricopeptide repeat protein [uncultured Algoriphagus sp.]
MKLRVWSSFLLFLVLSSYVFGQSPRQIVDSLLNSAQQENTDETLAAIYGELGWTYAAINLDSAIYYGQLAVELSEKTGDETLLAQSYSDLGSGYLQKGQLQEAGEVYLKSLEIREANWDSLGMAKVYNALGFILQRKYESDSAITYFLKALPIFEKEGALLNAATILNNIGVIYQNMSNYPKAIEFYERAAVMREAQKDFRNLIGSYANLGTAYKYLGDFELAEEYFQKAIDLAIREDDPLNLAVSYRMYAFFLQEKGDMSRLEEVAQKGLEAAKAVNALYEEATMEYALGVVENTKKNYKKAKDYLESAAEKFVSQGAEDDVFGPYLELITSFAALGDADSSRYYVNLYQSTLRSKEEKAAKELTAELETKYQTALKDSQISEQQLQIRNKNFQLYGSLLMALVLGLVGYLLYKQQKLKNRQLEQEVELKEALAQIETQNKLQEQRLLIARDLHDNIGAQLTFIISSIENLKYFEPIKETLTPRYESIANFTKQTIRELRDTIWAMNSGAVTLEDLVGRVKNFIQQGKQSTDVKLDFVQEEGLDLSKKISSANSIQILRILQEAVQNAVKYADASQILVIFSLGENQLQFQVIDNGKGFDLEKVKAGNGLGNMQKRAEEIEASLSVKSEIGRGTEISLLLLL